MMPRTLPNGSTTDHGAWSGSEPGRGEPPVDDAEFVLVVADASFDVARSAPGGFATTRLIGHRPKMFAAIARYHSASTHELIGSRWARPEVTDRVRLPAGLDRVQPRGVATRRNGRA